MENGKGMHKMHAKGCQAKFA